MATRARARVTIWTPTSLPYTLYQPPSSHTAVYTVHIRNQLSFFKVDNIGLRYINICTQWLGLCLTRISTWLGLCLNHISPWLDLHMIGPYIPMVGLFPPVYISSWLRLCSRVPHSPLYLNIYGDSQSESVNLFMREHFTSVTSVNIFKVHFLWIYIG